MKRNKTKNKTPKEEVAAVPAEKVSAKQAKKQGFDEQPKMSDLMPGVKKKILSDFDYLVENNPDYHVIELLSYMLSSQYAKTFQPRNLHMMKTCVANATKKFVSMKIQELLQVNFETDKRSGMTDEEIIEKMTEEGYMQTDYEEVSKVIKPILQEEIKKFVRERQEDLEEQIEENTSQEIQSQVTEKEVKIEQEKVVENKKVKREKKPKVELNAETIEKFKNSIKTPINLRMQDSITIKKEDVRRVANIRKRKEEIKAILKKHPKMSLEDIIFFIQVKNYTSDFSFLSERRDINNSFTGYRKGIKFKTREDYEKFEKIQSRLKIAVDCMNGDEAKAIEKLLEQSKGRLSKVETSILKERAEVLSKTRYFPENDEI